MSEFILIQIDKRKSSTLNLITAYKHLFTFHILVRSHSSRRVVNLNMGAENAMPQLSVTFWRDCEISQVYAMTYEHIIHLVRNFRTPHTLCVTLTLMTTMLNYVKCIWEICYLKEAMGENFIHSFYNEYVSHEARHRDFKKNL